MDNKKFYNENYMPKVNRIGKITGYLGVVLAFAPAIMLAIVYGILPNIVSSIALARLLQ